MQSTPFTPPSHHFQTFSGLSLQAAFDGGHITSDGGLPLLDQTEKKLGILSTMAALIPDWRKIKPKHSILSILRQRVFQVCCGYEDQNDATKLRSDPLFLACCGSTANSGQTLASQPTLSRFENSATRRSLYQIGVAILENYMQQREKDRIPTFILIDVDGTDDEIHGEQEGGAYNGYYRHHMLHSLLIFDGETGQIITAVLRPGNAHVKKGFLGILKRLVRAMRERWGKDLRIGLRADGGFAYPELYDYCESQERSIEYTIGIPPNKVIDRLALPTIEKAKLENQRLEQEHEARKQQDSQRQTQTKSKVKETKASELENKVRIFDTFSYRAKSWRIQRRIVVKAEILEKGPNTRFVVTNKPDEVGAKAIYDGGYTRRGECENWIKDFKNALQGDRLSCSSLLANQFRLFLYVAAYTLMDSLRKYLIQMQVPRMQMDTLRLWVLKIGAVVKLQPAAMTLHLSSHHPGQALWAALMAHPVFRE